MRRVAALVLLVLLLCGCGSENDGLDCAMVLRQKLLSAENCSFLATITADYGDSIYTFGMQCQMNSSGDITFQVTEPETISEITGMISEFGGGLTFDDHLLGFEPMADGTATPVIAPWLMLRSLRGGYIKSCIETEQGYTLILDDTYQSVNLRTEVHLNQQSHPVFAELYYDEKRILTISVSNFEML